jgi:hypothetical protein
VILLIIAWLKQEPTKNESAKSFLGVGTMAALDADPFDVFGSGDDDDDDILSEFEVARKLALHQRSTLRVSKESNEAGVLTGYAFPADKPKPQFPPWTSISAFSLKDLVSSAADVTASWPLPSYAGPIRYNPALPDGGGRGYVAACDIPAGTLVLVEEPLYTLPIIHNMDLDDLIECLPSLLSEGQHAPAVRRALEHLHPTKEVVDAVPSFIESPMAAPSPQVADALDDLAQRYGSDPRLLRLVDPASNLTDSDGSPYTMMDLWRVLLVLRYNLLQSGVYLHTALLNHHDPPNCVKFIPTGTSETDRGCFSEVRTTRSVSAGEALSISYLDRLLSHHTRRQLLWDQHRFDIGEAISDGSSPHYQMELVNGTFPTSQLQRSPDTSLISDSSYPESLARIERATEELRSIFNECRLALAEHEEAGGNQHDTALQHLQAVEQSALELYTATVDQLGNHRHLLLIPILRLHLDSANEILVTDQSKSFLTTAQRSSLLLRFLSSAELSIPLQQAYYGCDHYEAATTWHDIAQSISALLSISPEALLSSSIQTNGSSESPGAWPAGVRGASDWSRYEFECRKTFERIQSLYPHDARKHVTQFRKEILDSSSTKLKLH